MTDISIIAIDLAKNVFQVHGFNRQGERIIKKRLSRAKLADYVAQLPNCCIAMEDCSSANYWGRQFESFGHEVRLIAPKYVAPFRRGNKNDAQDADAIGEAASRAKMPYHRPKSIEAQDIQAIHRVRESYIARRTAVANQIRGFISEYGIVLPKGIQHLRRQLPAVLEDGDNQLSPTIRALLHELYEELKYLDQRIQTYTQQLETMAQRHETCRQLMTIEGIGPIIATALLTVLQGPNQFKNGRHFAAYLGLTPREYASGERQRFGGITKRGDPYLRKLLIQGSSAIVANAHHQATWLQQWLTRLKARKGTNCAKTALANRLARWAWGVYRQGQPFQEQWARQALVVQDQEQNQMEALA
jgi:transposase